MAEIIHGVKFEAVRVQPGWCVVIIPPNAGRVELHDFQTEAGAKAWINVNARNWSNEYIRGPSDWPIMSNPK